MPCLYDHDTFYDCVLSDCGPAVDAYFQDDTEDEPAGPSTLEIAYVLTGLKPSCLALDTNSKRLQSIADDIPLPTRVTAVNDDEGIAADTMGRLLIAQSDDLFNDILAEDMNSAARGPLYGYPEACVQAYRTGDSADSETRYRRRQVLNKVYGRPTAFASTAAMQIDTPPGVYGNALQRHIENRVWSRLRSAALAHPDHAISDVFLSHAKASGDDVWSSSTYEVLAFIKENPSFLRDVLTYPIHAARVRIQEWIGSGVYPNPVTLTDEK